MLHYRGPVIKKLEKLNTHTLPGLSRKRGGLNFGTMHSCKISFKIDCLLYFYTFKYRAYLDLYRFKQPDWTIFEVPELIYDNISYSSSFSEIKDDMSLDMFYLIFMGTSDNKYKRSSRVSMDIVMDDISVVDNMVIFLLKAGVIFTPFVVSLALFNSLVSRYMGCIVASSDNYFSSINSVVFTGGSFCYVPKNVKCNMNLSTYFRTYLEEFAQFERTLLVVGENAVVSYVEGCSAPIFLESQLHIALVELLVKEKGVLDYITVQNWYKGNQLGEGGLYNFTTKRGWCLSFATLNWVQVEMGSFVTWKYPSTYLKGDKSKSTFFSLALTSNYQISDTGNKMLHMGSYTKSKVFSKSMSFDNSLYTYRGMTKVFKPAKYVCSYIECDSLLFGNNGFTSTLPYLVVENYLTLTNQEASISKIESDFLFFLKQRGISNEDALTLLLYGFCSDICVYLPLELESEIFSLLSSYGCSKF